MRRLGTYSQETFEAAKKVLNSYLLNREYREAFAKYADLHREVLQQVAYLDSGPPSATPGEDWSNGTRSDGPEPRPTPGPGRGLSGRDTRRNCPTSILTCSPNVSASGKNS